MGPSLVGAWTVEGPAQGTCTRDLHEGPALDGRSSAVEVEGETRANVMCYAPGLAR